MLQDTFGKAQQNHDVMYIIYTVFFDNGEFFCASLITLRQSGIPYSNLMPQLKRLSSFELLEVAGLSKIWGHPLISGPEGIAKLQKRTSSEKTLNTAYLILTKNHPQRLL